MSPCPYTSQRGHRRRLLDKSKQPQRLAWVRSPGIHQPTSLWSFLANTLFPRRPIAAFNKNQWNRVHAQTKQPNHHGKRYGNLYRELTGRHDDGEHSFVEWCSHCHQYHPLHRLQSRHRHPNRTRFDPYDTRLEELPRQQERCL